VCNQNPTGVVHEQLGGRDRNSAYPGYVLFVQDDIAKASGNTKYLMLANLTIPETGTYDFVLASDDNFELYIDCAQIQTGAYGTTTFSVTLAKGVRQFILRYENVPDQTPGYAGFTMTRNGSVVYTTRAADWKGQANSIGSIEWA
jgi:hypothetical protein